MNSKLFLGVGLLTGTGFLSVLKSSGDYQYSEIEWVDEIHDPSITIETKTLVAKIIDNTGLLVPSTSPWPEPGYSHHLGYHGIRSFWHKQEKRNIVAPFVSWLNLQSLEVEGLELDPVDSRSRYGVGRGWPIRMSGSGERVVLEIMDMPQSGVDYRLELMPSGDDSLDFSVQFTLHKKNLEKASFSASWPCYMSTFDEVELFSPEGSPESFRWSSFGERENFVVGEPVGYVHSQRRFSPPQPVAYPLVYGRIGRNVLAVMVSRPEVQFFLINAGGHRAFLPVQNPAWDFSFQLDDYPVHEPFGFKGRIIYKPWKDPEEIVDRYLSWRSETASSGPR
ncbi:MAG: hypothetical protein ACWGQW_13105 [bacterium]